jgi:MATE family multidrug resistance protein
VFKHKLLLLLLLLLQVSLWYGGEIATWFFGQGPDVSALVSRYSRWMIPGLWPMVSAPVYLKLQDNGG